MGPTVGPGDREGAHGAGGTGPVARGAACSGAGKAAVLSRRLGRGGDGVGGFGGLRPGLITPVRYGPGVSDRRRSASASAPSTPLPCGALCGQRPWRRAA